jgi:hypothetical protein
VAVAQAGLHDEQLGTCEGPHSSTHLQAGTHTTEDNKQQSDIQQAWFTPPSVTSNGQWHEGVAARRRGMWVGVK